MREMKFFNQSIRFFIPSVLTFMLIPGWGFCRISQTHAKWSIRMAESVLKMHPEPWTLDSPKKAQWEYTYGVVLKALLEVWHAYGDEKYYQYVFSYYDRLIDSTGNIFSYRLEDYNIDNINTGKSLFAIYEKTKQERFRKAIELLRSQMKTHPRTSEGGFWHKKIYPYQMWLDGIYMASPFLAQYAKTFHDSVLFDEVAHQILLMESHARDPRTGLLYHGWDETRSQRWADPNTGLSSQFWGRAMGWYAMAIVDVLDFFPEDHSKRSALIQVFQRLAEAIKNVQDPKTGVWYQVLDQPKRKGNYREASASCMFVYALAKGMRKGYISPHFRNVVLKGYRGILRQFIRIDKEGLVHIDHVCAVAGLGGNPYRDGSFEYYVHEKITSDDPKAIGPFILASLEVEKMNSER